MSGKRLDLKQHISLPSLLVHKQLTSDQLQCAASAGVAVVLIAAVSLQVENYTLRIKYATVIAMTSS